MTDNLESANSTTSCDENSDNWSSNPTADILKEGLMNTLKPVFDQIQENVINARESQSKLNTTLNELHDSMKGIDISENIYDKQFSAIYFNKMSLANERLFAINSSLHNINIRLKHIDKFVKMKPEQLPTPDLSHFDRNDYENIYEPREDSFLLLDTLEYDMKTIRKLKPLFVAEVGSGSGIIITTLAAAFKNDPSVCFATDINNKASLATQKTSKFNHVIVESCTMNLLDSFRSGLFDLIVFNPPYVSSVYNEVKNSNLEKAWSGGINCGREVIDNFLSKLNTYLSERGVCYMLLSKENNIDDILQMTLNKFKLKSELINKHKILGEHLFIFKFYKSI